MGQELRTLVGMVPRMQLASTRRRTGLRMVLCTRRAILHRMFQRMVRRTGRAMDRVTGRASRVHPVVSRRAACRCGRCSLRR
jgi:hypothetical protein